MARIIEDNYAPSHEVAVWDFPLYSEILPGLWLGGTDDDDTIDFAADTYENRNITIDDFEAVATLYAWARPVDWFVTEMRYGFYDSNSITIDKYRLNTMVDFVYNSWKGGKKTLVRCQAGINRSSYVMAYVLMREGFSPEEAINLMRSKRSSYVLMNKSFEEEILGKEDNES